MRHGKCKSITPQNSRAIIHMTIKNPRTDKWSYVHNEISIHYHYARYTRLSISGLDSAVGICAKWWTVIRCNILNAMTMQSRVKIAERNTTLLIAFVQVASCQLPMPQTAGALQH